MPTFTVGVACMSLAYEVFIMLVGVLGAEIHRGNVEDMVEDGYHCMWFAALLSMFISVLQIIFLTGKCNVLGSRNVSLFVVLTLFFSIVLTITSASIFTDKFGEGCGTGETEDDCKAQLFFLYASPLPIRATMLWFKSQDTGFVRIFTEKIMMRRLMLSCGGHVAPRRRYLSFPGNTSSLMFTIPTAASLLAFASISTTATAAQKRESTEDKTEGPKSGVIRYMMDEEDVSNQKRTKFMYNLYVPLVYAGVFPLVRILGRGRLPPKTINQTQIGLVFAALAHAMYIMGGDSSV